MISESRTGVTLAAQSLFSKTPVSVIRQRTVFPIPPTLSMIDFDGGRGVIRIALAKYLISVESDIFGGINGFKT